MKLEAITRKEAARILRSNGYAISEGDGRTYFATNEDRTDVWEFDSKAKRDKAVKEEK